MGRYGAHSRAAAARSKRQGCLRRLSRGRRAQRGAATSASGRPTSRLPAAAPASSEIEASATALGRHVCVGAAEVNVGAARLVCDGLCAGSSRRGSERDRHRRYRRAGGISGGEGIRPLLCGGSRPACAKGHITSLATPCARPAATPCATPSSSSASASATTTAWLRGHPLLVDWLLSGQRGSRWQVVGLLVDTLLRWRLLVGLLLPCHLRIPRRCHRDALLALADALLEHGCAIRRLLNLCLASRHYGALMRSSPPPLLLQRR